ncbi:NnrS family protein [Thiomonas sp. FB-6]|uniref:NnrS family protein n=1 Tax=Thiomonas sp. FB-6 TaxID=1158291 RepID=UPI0003A3927E|nr:NnrS family protein [Thiomonas sp. FB-6]
MARLQVSAETAAHPAATGWPLLRLGFRPFYLGASAYAVLAMGLWFLVFTGRMEVAPRLSPVLWHAHEMLYGFVVAVIVGFLLTAGRVWTQLSTPRGPALGALFALWAAGRVAAASGPYMLFFLLDGSFLIIVAAVFAGLLLRAGNRRNAAVGGVLALLALLALANVLFHLAVLAVVPIDPMRAIYAAIALVVLLECIIGGRVIPQFSRNAVPGLQLAVSPRRELLAAAVTGIGLLAWVLGAPATATAVLLAATAVLQALRLLSWKPWRSLGRPILWVLHLGYAWIPVGLALLAAAQVGWIPASPALHALTVGSMGGLIIGMLTRTARGHTARPLQAGPVEVAAYAALLLAALVRVAAPLLLPALSVPALLASGLLWMLGFAAYLARFAPWLLATRLDGRDG